MISKSGHRFSEKIMLKQKPEARGRFDLKPFRFKEAPLHPKSHLSNHSQAAMPCCDTRAAAEI